MVFYMKKKLNQQFKCKTREKMISIEECLELFLNANSLNQKNSPCFKCSYGQKIRADFANS